MTRTETSVICFGASRSRPHAGRPTVRTLSVATFLILAASLALSLPAAAQPVPEYNVTIYNLTRDQPFSPPLLVTHNADVSLFHAGNPASPELARMAEDGDNGPLASLLASLSDVYAVASAAGPIPPGGSATVTIRGGFPFHRLSVVGMLVNTNDAFFAFDTVTLPRLRFEREGFYAAAWDAGSEADNEDCGFMPGPACAGAGAGVRSTGGAEGKIFIHAGIHGGGDLDPASHDWRNPVAKIVAQRVR